VVEPDVVTSVAKVMVEPPENTPPSGCRVKMGVQVSEAVEEMTQPQVPVTTQSYNP
jgi:DNA gyrase inhibitor GyrI